MDLDQQLSHPLAPVRDDGFSIFVTHRVRAGERRMRLAMWGLLALGFVPVLAVLPFVDISVQVTPHMAQWLQSQFAYPLGLLLLLWVWKPRLFPR